MNDTKNLQEKNRVLHDLMITYGQDVWNYAFSLTRRLDLTDDITQDVFVKVYEKMDSFRGDSSVRTWLLTITRNVAYDYRRSAFFRKVILMDFILDKGSHPSAEKEAIDSLITNEVWKQILRLPVKHREVLVLYAHHHLSIAEISVLLGVSEGTIKARLHRARKKITNLLMDGESDGKAPV